MQPLRYLIHRLWTANEISMTGGKTNMRGGKAGGEEGIKLQLYENGGKAWPFSKRIYCLKKEFYLKK